MAIDVADDSPVADARSIVDPGSPQEDIAGPELEDNTESLAGTPELSATDDDGDAGIPVAPATPVGVPEPVGPAAVGAVGPPANESTTDRRFMRNGVTIAGMMHVVNNMMQDVHKSLTYWPEFYADLKVVEALLQNPERRRRFVWTCLRGTPLDFAGRKFNNFKSELYEPRWGEVMKFLKELVQVLPFLARGWDARKYVKGVDGSGRHREDEKDGKKREDSRKLAFDPAALSVVLRKPLFSKYMSMLAKIEMIPEKLARKTGGCPCHEPLVESLSKYSRERLLFCHYGKTHPCPLAGAFAPNMAAGVADEIATAIFDVTEGEVMVLVAEIGHVGEHPLSRQEIQILVDNFRQARHATLLILKIKLKFWETLPWLFCGLAHEDEQVARRIGLKIIEEFNRDPRRQVR